MNILPVLYLKHGKAVIFGTDSMSQLANQNGDPIEVAQALSVFGEILIFDLDAAQSSGCNTEIIEKILRIAKCRVSGGICTVDAALDWLDKGVTKVIVSATTINEANNFKDLPNDRVVISIEVTAGEVVTNRKDKISVNVEECVKQFKSYANEFLIIFCDTQGKMEGIKKMLPLIETTVEDTQNIAICGGIGSIDDILSIDKMKCTVVIGTALHAGKIELGNIVSALVKSDRPDGLYPTVVVDEQGIALGMVYSDDNSIKAALKKRKGIYHSRKRGLWEKGLTSGATQTLIQVKLDCDRDALLYIVHQEPKGFCHLNRRTCWSSDTGIGKLFRTLEDRRKNPVKKSYTNRLLNDRELLHSKLLEESQELIEAKTYDEVASECADVVYFASVICARSGVPWHAVEEWLNRRSRRVRRRKGDAKPNKTPKLISDNTNTAENAISTNTIAVNNDICDPAKKKRKVQDVSKEDSKPN